MASEPRSQQPRVSIMLPDGPLRAKILDVLEGSDVEVEIVGEAGLREDLSEAEPGVVLVHTDQVDSRALETLSGTSASDSTGFAVIGEDDPAARARLFAAGASHVIGDADDPQVVGESLEALAETEAGGGLDGPQVRGGEAEPRLTDFLTRSPTMREFVELVRRVVGVDTSLLLTGPTGVGKERLARAIHAEGPRAGGPFRSVNCGALPETLLESELFGHERGAFTGADRRRKGHFEAASGGTMFLDEIGEMPMHLQVKLLTVLQRHEVVRLGGHEPIPVDVRLIAATNRDLAAEVRRGRFREDLYYRLNVVMLRLPPLSERPEDIPDLAGRFIAHFRETTPASPVESISDAAVDALMRYAWPGNIRELINVIERAMVLGRGPEITPDDLPPAIAAGDVQPASAAERPRDDASRATRREEWLGMTLREVRERAVRDAESGYLRLVLGECRGRIDETAARAGLSTRALYERMRRYGLRKEDFKGARD